MTKIDIAIALCIAGVPLGLLIMAFVVALGKRPGNRRRPGNQDMQYDGPERRCKFRAACEVGRECRDQDNCIFAASRERYIKIVDLRAQMGISVQEQPTGVE